MHMIALQRSHFDEKFLSIVDYSKFPTANKDVLLKKLEDTSCKHVYRFPVFTHEFCDEFIEELEHFQKSDLPKGRPNTMNHYGVCYLFSLISFIYFSLF